MAQHLVSKISAKSVGLDAKLARTEVQEAYVIIGWATEIEEGLHQTNGEWTKLKGNFEATNSKTGDVYVSTNAFLPAVVNDLVAKAIKDGGEVKFAYRIGTKPMDSTVGYEYTVSPLVAAEPVSIIEEIRTAAGLTGAKAISSKK